MTDRDRLTAALADRYTIQYELGAGGMATVYLAEDVKHHRKVAVKVLRPDLAAVLGAERFLKEIELTANLQHPHLLPLHDSGEAGGFLYYVMPYVEGESLRDKLDREKQLGVEETIKIAEGVAAALDYAHRHDVIHRDIKPENILLHDGQALVADFGIALAVKEAGGARLTETGLSLGTPEYMSPEQAMGERELTARSDVYALGAITYEMLVGQPPFTGSTVQAVVAQVVGSEPRPVTAARPAVPGHVEAATQCALAKVPADRFARATEFAEALRNPAYTGPATGTAATAREWSRKTLTTITTASIAVTAVAIVVAILGWGREPHPPPGPAVRFDLPIVNGGELRLPGGLALSPDGTTIVYRGRDSTGTFHLYLRELSRLESVRLRGTEEATEPTFSPDGSSIAFVQDGQLRTMALSGGDPRTVTEDNTGGASWGPDGMIVFTKPPGGALALVAADGGTPVLIRPGDSTRSGPIPQNPTFLPGGQWVVFQEGFGNRAPLAAMSMTGEVRQLDLRGRLPAYANGILTYMAPGGMHGVAFDPERLQVSGRPQLITDGVFFHYAVSRTGTIAYLTRQGRTRLVELDRQGREIDLGAPRRGYGHPRYSPDGQEIALHTGGDVRRFDIARQSLERITFDRGGWPEWAPDGQHVIYGAGQDTARALFVAAADGSGTPRLLLKRPGAVPWQALFTPDGETVLFWEWVPTTDPPGGNQNIWMADVARLDRPRPLATTEYDENAMALSPDGQWLAYVSDETGEREVYIRRIADGENGSRWQVSTGGGFGPRWSPRGDEIFYVHNDSLYAAAVDVTGGQEPRRERPVALFAFRAEGQPTANAWYDVHPNGDRFVAVRTRFEIHVMVNALPGVIESR